jgi:Tfp pilus assembly protein PilF
MKPSRSSTPPATAAALVLSLSCLAATCGPRITEKDLKKSDLHLEMATNHLEQGRLLDARREAFLALQANPKNAEAHFMLAYVFSRLNEWAKAEESARLAIKHAEHYPEASNLLGVVLIEQGRPAEAVKILEEVVQDFLYTTPHLAYGNLGLAFFEMGRYDEAIDVLERAVELQPMFCTGHYRLGLVYFEMKRYKDALESLTEAVTTEDPWGTCPRLTDAYRIMGTIHLELDSEEDALENLRRCYELEPDTATGLECRTLMNEIEGAED